mgnify:FL=1
MVKPDMKKILLLVCIIPLFYISVFADTVPAGYKNAAASAKNLNASVFWDPLAGNGILQKNGHQISFRAGESVILLDYLNLLIVDPPIFSNNVLYFSDSLLKAAEELFSTQNNDANFRVGAILIDPGHGGKDPGAVASHTIGGKKTSIQEKDIALTTALELHSLLSASYPDKKILLTRSTDIYLSLEQRVDIANSVNLQDNEAVIYVSIHANAAFDKKAGGYEVWYLSPGYRRSVLSDSGVDKDLLPILNSMMEEEYTTESILIAKFILEGMDTQIGKQMVNRGIKEEEWFVVRNAHMPSVLVELGFITNSQDAALLNDKIYLRKTALGIYNGLGAFITHFEQSRGFTGTR